MLFRPNGIDLSNTGFNHAMHKTIQHITLNNPAMRNTTISIRTHNVPLLLITGLLILLWSNGFELKVFHLSDRFAILLIAAVFILVGCTALRLPFLFTQGAFKNRYFCAIFGIFSIALFSIFFNSVLLGGHGLVEMPRQGFTYCGLLIFVFMLSCRTDSSFVPALNALILGICVINMLLIIGVSLFPGMIEELFVRTGTRLGSARLRSPLWPLFVYSILYCMVMCSNDARSNNSRLFYLTLFVLFMWYFLFIDMTRHTILGFIMVMGYYWLFHMKIGHKGIAIFLTLVLLAGSLAFTNVTVFDAIGSTFSSTIDGFRSNKGTIAHRIEGIYYYMDKFEDGGYIGIGPAKFSWTVLESSAALHYNPVDHGLFAVLYQFGFQAIVLTLVLLFMMFRDLRAVRRFGPKQYQPIAMAIWLYLLFVLIDLRQVYWRHQFALWTGIILFMTWRMLDEMRRNSLPVQKQNRLPGRAAARGT